MDLCDISPGLMPIEDALEHMLSGIQNGHQPHNIPVDAALDRVAAEDINALMSVPPHHNSAMDGYALRFEDVAEYSELTVIGTQLAGAPTAPKVDAGQCVRIMTGATLPQGCNTVVMQENVTVLGNDRVKLSRIPAKQGDNVRNPGEDIATGDIVIRKGTQLTAVHCALLHSIGIEHVRVFSKVKVAIMATGNELVPVGIPLKPGQIYETNRTVLKGMLSKHNVIVEDLGIIADTPQATEQALQSACQFNNLVISCGGVSVGEADFVKPTLDKLGKVNFWKVAIKPGKPFAFGTLGDALFCGLPGNPVSSYVTFLQLVTPLLKHLAGLNHIFPETLQATLAEPVFKRPGRKDFQRGIYRINKQGKLLVTPHKKQGSGILSSITNANCLIVLEADQGNVPEGATVEVQILNGC